MKLPVKFLLTFMLMLMAITAMAHKNLDAVIHRIESKSDVQYVACSERRNPQTKRIYKSSKVIVISQPDIIKQLIKAFKSDSKDAELYEIARNGGVYNIRFVDKDEERCYTLILNSGVNRGDALLTVEYINRANARQAQKKGQGRADNDSIIEEYGSPFFYEEFYVDDIIDTPVITIGTCM